MAPYLGIGVGVGVIIWMSTGDQYWIAIGVALGVTLGAALSSAKKVKPSENKSGASTDE